MTALQSVLVPSGADAERIAALAWTLFAGALCVFLVVGAALWIAMRGSAVARHRLAADKAVIVGGIVFPVVVLGALLVYGLSIMRQGIAAIAGPGALHVEVTGEQWWWRVIYRDADGSPIESANEIRIPAGRDVVLTLASADVIHSFWVPNLAGKVDMIPGRRHRLKLAAAKPGIYRGQCAEYCGGAHALMSLEVVALPEADFASWLASARDRAAEPSGEIERRGRDLFLSAGCGSCHAVRGTSAKGEIGPDLTRVGERRYIAAATLPTSRENLARFIVDGQHLKPGNGMPPFRVFSAAELDAVAAYLASLR